MTEIDLRTERSYVSFRLEADDLPQGLTQDHGSLGERSLALARMLLEANGVAQGGPVEFVVDPAIGTDRAGGKTVYLRQAHQGVPVFGAQQVISFDHAQAVDRTQARVVPVTDEPSTEIAVTAEAAYARAWHVIFDPKDGPPADDPFPPEVLATFPDLPERPTAFTAAGFGEPIRAHLVWFPIEQSLQLAWQVDMALERSGVAYRTIISVKDGAVFYSVLLGHGLTQSAEVFALSPAAPRATVDWPTSWTAYPVDAVAAPAGPPQAWTDGALTKGYSVEAFDADTKQPFAAVETQDGIRFAPADPEGQDQGILNAFYACAMMHDFMHLLGFSPEDGSYESGGQFGGLASKPVRVAVSTAPVPSVANWWRGAIRLGPNGNGRHASLDVSVVAHEYTHGVSNRLVGGGLDDAPLVEPQSRAMAEGWSDYFACMATGQRVIGGWLAADGVKGLRRFAYDDRFPAERANLGILATLSTYEVGEMWCAFLCDFTRRIGARAAPGLVLDSMRGLIANPNLLDGRDNLLLKIGRLENAGMLTPDVARHHKAAVWAAAARFGMGTGAKIQGTSLGDAMADGSVPDL